MKKIFIALCLLSFANVCFADVYVNGYYRGDGRYVKPHYRSNPDGYTYNNYSNTRNNSTFSNYNSYSNNNSTTNWAPNAGNSNRNWGPSLGF
ncbi:hypothetical protein J6Q66_04070 [bacterium]|nr:hypothetical protein [bacterium]